MQTQLSDAFRYVDNGADAVLIWFGGLNEPFLNDAFLQGEGLNGLFLRDTRADWYTGGIEGVADGFEAALAFVHEFLVSRGVRYPVMAGQSSGGYAALRAAWLMKPCLVVAFSPQTANRPGPGGGMQPEATLVAIEDLYRLRSPDCPIVLHLARSEDSHRGEFFWDDWAQVKPLEPLPDVTLIRHPTDHHAVTLYLYGQALFYEGLLSDIRLYSRPRIPLGLTQPSPASSA